jgi:chromosome segregation ATPase
LKWILKMPARGITTDPVADFIKVVSDPRRFAAMREEYSHRREAAEQAEQRAKEAAAELDAKAEALTAREKLLEEALSRAEARAKDIEARWAACEEREAMLDQMAKDVDARATEVRTEGDDAKRARQEAITAIKRLLGKVT